MKGSTLFWLWCIGIILIVLFLPSIISILFVISSNYVHPLVFIGFILLLSAVIAYYGGINRKK